MNSDFHLDNEHLIEIAHRFKREIDVGLKTSEGNLTCIPAYVDIRRCPCGRALVLDFGGTHIRAAVVSASDENQKIEKGPLSAEIPVIRGTPLSQEMFLNTLAALIERLDPEPGLPLGYCFSYPVKSEPGGDALLMNWTKEVQVPDMVGKPVGRLLLDALEKKGIHCSRVTVINDAIASLLAGVSQKKADSYAGLIVGTGANMAALIDSDRIAFHKINGRHYPLPVNLESGNFSPPFLTLWDDIVDRRSDKPGKQRFEKAVSGAYLGRIMDAVLPGEMKNAEMDSETVSTWAFRPGACDEKSSILARLLLERSAKLVAAGLAGLLLFLNEGKSVSSFYIVAEGGMILNSPGYKQNVNRVLHDLIEHSQLSVNAEIVQITHANLFGSAFAALSQE